ncbi:hypothetical protein WG66_004437 [Moniliophthora roreri]|nr:hypothetical protein WG66_004437 [Moniliophthora roreri]
MDSFESLLSLDMLNVVDESSDVSCMLSISTLTHPTSSISYGDGTPSSLPVDSDRQSAQYGMMRSP